MNRFKFDEEKAVASLLYIAKKLGKDKADLHSVFKTLYFAEQKHLVRYGRPVTGEIYSALRDGPVPSALYDLCKDSRKLNIPYKNLFQLDGRWLITVLSDPNLDEFSESDLECLDEAIKEIEGLSYNDRRGISHDPAYTQAWIKKGSKKSQVIDVIDIAIAGGADKEMIKFIKEELEFINAFC